MGEARNIRNIENRSQTLPCHSPPANSHLGAGKVPPPCPALCRHAGLPHWLQFWVGQRAILQEAETAGALNLTSRPESASHVGARVGVGGPFSLSGVAPFSWRDIKTHTKCFHVVPGLSLCPSRRINPWAARTDMSSQLCFHVCPQFQRHHTKSRLIVNRPSPTPPLPALPRLPPLPPPHLDPTTFPGGLRDLCRLRTLRL